MPFSSFKIVFPDLCAYRRWPASSGLDELILFLLVISCRYAAISCRVSVLLTVFILEHETLIFPKGQIQDHPQNPAGYDLADAHGQHHQWDREQHAISETQHKRHNDRVGDDRGERCDKTALVTETVCKESSEQCGQAPEDDIWEDRAASDIADETADK